MSLLQGLDLEMPEPDRKLIELMMFTWYHTSIDWRVVHRILKSTSWISKPDHDALLHLYRAWSGS